jgi:hypothetical protein
MKHNDKKNKKNYKSWKSNMLEITRARRGSNRSYGQSGLREKPTNVSNPAPPQAP